MKTQYFVFTIALVLLSGLLIGPLHSDEAATNKNGLLHVAAAEADFVELVPGIYKAILWGDHDAGPYGAFTRFAPGTENDMHVHSHTVRIVVLEGAYIYKDDEVEKRVGPGEFISIPGGKKHWSGGDEEQGALFYEESAAGFDLIPAQ